jgi:hypothetical protein
LSTHFSNPLMTSPPNKLTEVLWGLINCIPTLVLAIVMTASTSFNDNDKATMTVWLIAIISSFAIIFAINSSIHSYLVVKYASRDKVAVSVGFYYMSNACGRLMGTLGSGVLYTYVGTDLGSLAGQNIVAGFAACFFAGTASSFLAVIITWFIQDNQAGLKCGPCLTLVSANPVDMRKEDKDALENDENREDDLVVRDMEMSIHSERSFSC